MKTLGFTNINMNYNLERDIETSKMYETQPTHNSQPLNLAQTLYQTINMNLKWKTFENMVRQGRNAGNHNVLYPPK